VKGKKFEISNINGKRLTSKGLFDLDLGLEKVI
jgi:hypothetical protein